MPEKQERPLSAEYRKYEKLLEAHWPLRRNTSTQELLTIGDDQVDEMQQDIGSVANLVTPNTFLDMQSIKIMLPQKEKAAQKRVETLRKLANRLNYVGQQIGSTFEITQTPENALVASSLARVCSSYLDLIKDEATANAFNSQANDLRIGDETEVMKISQEILPLKVKVTGEMVNFMLTLKQFSTLTDEEIVALFEETCAKLQPVSVQNRVNVRGSTQMKFNGLKRQILPEAFDNMVMSVQAEYKGAVGAMNTLKQLYASANGSTPDLYARSASPENDMYNATDIEIFMRDKDNNGKLLMILQLKEVTDQSQFANIVFLDYSGQIYSKDYANTDSEFIPVDIFESIMRNRGHLRYFSTLKERAEREQDNPHWGWGYVSLDGNKNIGKRKIK